MPTAKQKIVILGGGIGALSAAFELTERPAWKDQIESITVYQMGWRLGGKGASGRNPNFGQRIEEHGLHVWPGFYENAFQLMRRCYAELNRPEQSPLSRWDDAFKPQHLITVTEFVDSKTKHWSFNAPPNASLPGDSVAIPDIWDYVVGGLNLMVGWFHQAMSVQEPPTTVSLPKPGFFQRILRAGEKLFDVVHLSAWASGLRDYRLHRLLRSVVGNADQLRDQMMMDVALQLALRIKTSAADAAKPVLDLLIWLVDRAMSQLESELGEYESLDDALRRLWIQLDFSRTMLRGMVNDRVFTRGFDSIDDETFVDWMYRHGASRGTLDSALMRGLHDFVFAYEAADPDRPNIAAGVALRLILRMTLTYRGAVMWKMQAGMGDVVFAPLYEVLKTRGVEFKFFHQVEQLSVSQDEKSISSVSIGRQASLVTDNYDPLVEVNGLPCWPHQPRFEQLVEGEILETQQINLESVWSDWQSVEQLTLTAGRDYDTIILGIPLAALRHSCDQLVRSDPAWGRMLEHIGTVKTRSLQLWFQPSLAELGWTLTSPILTANDKSLETWADMSQTLLHEDWADEIPKNVAYFCGTMADDDESPSPGPSSFPAQQKRIVQDDAIDWLKRNIEALFPAAFDAATGELDWSQLHDPADGSAVERFERQFWKANVEPSDRYVQSFAGTTKFRLEPGRSGFDKLYLAGDWTRNGLNVGCIEAAVISGRRAGRAILGDSQPVDP